MTKKADFSPMGENETAQSVDIIESDSQTFSPMGENMTIQSSREVIGAIKQAHRINQFSGATLIIELARVQAAYRGEGSLALDTGAETFKQYVEGAGLNYKTVTSKISHMKKIGHQLFQMFEELGVPVTLQRQIKRLPANLRKRLDDALMGSPAESADEVAAVFRELTAHTVTLQDKLDEAETKTKADLIDERDRMKDHYELVEERMVNMNDRIDKQQEKIKALLASQKPDEKALAIRKINDQMEVYFKTLSEADLAGDDLAILTEKHRFQKLINRATDLGIN
ncbi:MAG: hypothetical protein K9N29_11135 [Candidatus Marinimicrobia bacterium]|nr:hypothetical protein [Candidatus Neomarinimicrobiota bacterium]